MKWLGIGVINALALIAIIGLNPGRRECERGKNIKPGIGKGGRGDMRRLLVQGAHAVLRTGRNTLLGQWGCKLFTRKGQRNIKVGALARKLLAQVCHALMGNRPDALETDKSFATFNNPCFPMRKSTQHEEKIE